MSKPTESGKAQYQYMEAIMLELTEKTDTYEQEQKYSECAGYI